MKKLILPLVIILLSAFATRALVKSRPEVETRESEPLAPLVRVLEVASQDLTFDVQAQGTVLPRTETTLVAQVPGEIVSISRNFETGGFFDRGEVLVTLDARDYEVAVRRARAQVAQAELALVQQEAEAKVAIEEWNELGEEGEPSALVMRQPQMAQARAGLEASRAELEKAELDLERTSIRAPFAGRVRAKQVDRGQFLPKGAVLATIHATDYAEIRLPVPADQLSYLDLPFTFRNGQRNRPGPTARLWASFGRDRHSWQGRIVRTEGELDSRSRMMNLVARVEDPYGAGQDPGRPPLAVGLFVEAEIEGRSVADLIVLPRSALRPSGDRYRVLVVDDEDRLRFRDVEVARLEGEQAMIAAGLESRERVCVTPLDVVTEGMQVRTITDGRTIADGSEGTAS
ncbi:MAG: efflux RND transporter periplasmic adaptor subunit [Acidobacteriota bacterium]